MRSSGIYSEIVRNAGARRWRALRHYYRMERRHQMETYGNSGLHIDGKDAREFTGGSAAYQCHAEAAYWSARRHMHFMSKIEGNAS
ncbi:MAG: hypothetical protein JKY34_02630 [Kordiimonadaceae bacterium]|nr:hypothetical protein [Kordiimonadaceae bacterium]